MEFLVTMTTRVPDGTAAADVDDIRSREAARSRELAAAGHLLRLWRPPLAPGEWRSLGLFAAADANELEKVLASMPLRVWRTDEVTPLSPHPNDPVTAQQTRETLTEYLTTFTQVVPDGTPEKDFADAKAGEARRTAELAGQGHLIRLWAMPPEGDATRALGLWAARDGDEIREIMESLPLAAFLTTTITPLTRHPSDPGHSRP